MKKSLVLGICVALFVALVSRGLFAPAQSQSVTAAQDRQRLMDLLRLPTPGPFPPAAEDPNRPQFTTQRSGSTNWYDEAGNTYVRSNWGNWSNYEETKANPYPLPDPLILKNGRPVKNANTWKKERRAEILNDFFTEIYGRIPVNTPKVTWEVTSNVTDALSGTAKMKTVVGHIDNSAFPAANPSINLTMYTPANVRGPVPLIMVVGAGFGGRGGMPGTVAQPAQAQGAGARPGGAGAAGAGSAMAQVLAAGYGYATFATSVVQADNGAGLTSGMIGLVNRGEPRKPDDWGVLAAWSWGLSCALDFFETDKTVDAKQVGLEGHSRWGKAALVAMAFDPRFAIVYSSCSGEAGAKLSRRNWGETVDNVAGSGEYHWMAGNFLKYGGHWNDIPVDAHELIALCAPRPVFITGGTQDQWSDPRGEFLACVGAGPAYRLLGKKDLGTMAFPDPDVELISGEIGFRLHKGGHSDAPDWPVFLKFAQKYLQVSGGKANDHRRAR
jgi:hypothetical protein